MKKLFDKFVKGHTHKRKNTITVRLSGWHLVAILGVISILVSYLCSLRYQTQFKRKSENKKIVLEEKQGLKKSKKEIGFVYREPGEKHELEE